MTTIFTVAVICLIIGGAWSAFFLKIVADNRKARIDFQKKLEAEEVKKDEIKETFNTGNKLDNIVNTLDLLDKLYDVKSGKK